MSHPKVSFLQAKTPQMKISLLFDCVNQLFQEGKRMTILAPTEEALHYIDHLLWSYQPDAFLPHAITYRPTEEVIALTNLHANLNKSIALINLSPEKPKALDSFEEIYDLLDETTPQKAEKAEEKRLSYK